jgi:large subunit ribosomal protein L4e
MVKLFDSTGNVKGDIKLPSVFSTSMREDIIKRVVLALQANKRQAYGANRYAGLRTSAHYHGVKDTRGSMKNREIARLPRSHNTSGGQEWRARRVPQTVGGRRSHPPTSEKIWTQKVNKKEMVIAVKSAIAATANPELVSKRGHKFSCELPIIFDDSLNDVKTTKEMKNILFELKLQEDLIRGGKKKVRAGKGTMRGRRYKRSKSVLVVSVDDSLEKPVGNIPGCDFKTLKKLTVEDLAPGTVPGRLTIWTEGAIKKLGELYG